MTTSFSEFRQRKPAVTEHQFEYEGESITFHTRKMSSFHRNQLFTDTDFANVIADQANRKEGEDKQVSGRMISAMAKYQAATVAFTVCHENGELYYESIEEAQKDLEHELLDMMAQIISNAQPIDTVEEAEKN